jgi:(p)ppGpp synthase/HD superfamily hydrolase
LKGNIMATAKNASKKPIHTRGSYKFLRHCKEHFAPPIVSDIEDAYDLSKYGHHKQIRDDGRRYFDHPRAVANISLRELGIYDVKLTIVEILHDMPEDSFLLNHNRINHRFQNDVAQDVWLVTKLKKHKGPGIKNYFKRLVESSSWRAILAKCLDRLHNMRTLGPCSREKQLKQVVETRTYVLPLLDVLAKIIPREYEDRLPYVRKCLTELCNHYEKYDTPAKLTRKMIV